jgi:hypothetical protein
MKLPAIILILCACVAIAAPSPYTSVVFAVRKSTYDGAKKSKVQAICNGIWTRGVTRAPIDSGWVTKYDSATNAWLWYEVSAQQTGGYVTPTIISNLIASSTISTNNLRFAITNDPENAAIEWGLH